MLGHFLEGAVVPLASTIEQDRAAGGIERRKLRIQSGDVVTASLQLSGKAPLFTLTLRFKSGPTVSRPVGKISASTRFEALKLGWEKVREEKLAEKNSWSWITP